MKKAEELMRTAAVNVLLPALLGYVVGMLLSSALGFVLPKLTASHGMTDVAVNVAGPGGSTSTQRGLGGFLASNPFKISPQKKAAAPAPKPKVEVEPKLSSSVLDNVILRGTLPGVGGWFEQNGRTTLVLVGNTIERYRLSSVRYDEATFRRGHDTVKKYLTYGPVVPVAAKPAPAPSRPVAQAPAPNNGQVVAASANSEGSISAEMVNNLVQNPFDELKRIRMRPNEKSGGLEVQWIQNDSILRQLGVQRGDIIRSVNGIPFTNMGDIANSINSLINSERFDVEVTRGGKATALRYTVK